jgi:hypothetical protein
MDLFSTDFSPTPLLRACRTDKDGLYLRIEEFHYPKLILIEELLYFTIKDSLSNTNNTVKQSVYVELNLYRHPFPVKPFLYSLIKGFLSNAFTVVKC